MLTGSFALAYYATPRKTRDLDLVVAIDERDVGGLVRAFEADFYIDGDAARAAIRAGTLFNLMHLSTGIKVDLLVRKSSEYREVEFARRQLVEFAGVRTSIVSVEDLVPIARDAARMNDTPDDIAALVAKRHRDMTPAERMRAAAASFEVARAIVESSLPRGLSRTARRLAVARRFYAGELPESALLAHARFGESAPP